MWVLNRNVPRVWGRLALLSVPVERDLLLGKGGFVWVPVLLVLCPALGHLGGRMFRLGANLGRNVEIRCRCATARRCTCNGIAWCTN